MKKVLLLLSVLFSSTLALAQATQMSGTLNNPDGTGFNGQLIMSLAQQASIANTGGCGGPVMVPPTVQVIIKFVNGTMQSPPKIYGSDCTLPYGVPYNVVAKDNQGNIDFTAQWLPIGANQNIGTIQSVINPLGTLFGLSLSDIALTNASNTFSQNNTFQQSVSIGGNLTVAGTLFGPNNGPLAIGTSGGTFDLTVSNGTGVTLYVADNGNISIPQGTLSVQGTINSNNGYQYNGTAPSGLCLLGNGTVFLPGACSSVAPTQFYQTVASNGADLPQRAMLDFQPRFTVLDNPGANWSYVDLAATGVVAGTYTNPTLAIDGYGRITSASTNTTSTQVIQAVTVKVGICTTPSSGGKPVSYGYCGTPVIWPTPFPNASYTPVCTAGTPTNNAITGVWIDINSITASGLTFYFANGSENGGNLISLISFYCMGVYTP